MIIQYQLTFPKKQLMLKYKIRVKKKEIKFWLGNGTYFKLLQK